MDPYTVALIPRTRTLTATGGVSDTPAAPRASQTVKLILLNFDQRGTFTVAGGQDRVIDYHMLMLPDAAVAVGDYWTDGTKLYEVVGLSYGFAYEKKAFVSSSVPRDQTPL